jgi:hypoxanthine phosphoribosyltransferase
MTRDIEKILFDKNILDKKILSLAKTISENYKNSEFLQIISLMSGSLIFTADLIRYIDIPIKLNTITVSSYYDGITSSGNLKIQGELPICTDKDVLIVDDILDSGLTLSSLRDKLYSLNPRSVKTCVLLNKKIDRLHNITPDYYGFDIENEFVIGYGMDYQGLYRNLPYIGVLNTSGII